ncbi:ABC transporter ATP-binding protein [Phaeobacter gallaeciensis]|uniref:ABC transporter ATP-binding protein n=2 Tax=Roseobacteraceae TaxID=2854170 RepID=A0A366X7P9_9RHOB|nr:MULTISPECIES: ABC transporter ATP-binding protein [Roseobacteraceae]MBT3142786.1 ABC transporter ATP-binding protein/permease [Falsiruegeria litorea]MBT8168310.1 ABC transporter ATP-binding protein/permease [Falsiruegeria litorea]RBW61467.1 ABC transporter ATP-binding protein [Phaeobacter gallaeciensis]
MSSKQKSSRELLGWLWRDYLRHHIGVLAIAMFFMLLEGSMVGALSYMMQPMFDTVFVAGNTDALKWVSLAFLLIFVIRGGAGVAQKVLLAKITQTTAAHLRSDLLRRLIQQDTSFHQEHPPGFLIQRVQTDVGAVNQVWQMIVTGAGRDVISLIVLLGVAINVDLVWTLIMLVGVPLLLLPVGAAQKYVRKKASAARDLGASLATRLDEIFHGIIPIKLNSLEAYQQKRFDDQMSWFVRSEIRALFGTASITGAMDVMAGLGFMGVLFYGGHEIIAGEKTVGEFMSFFTAIGLLFDPMRRLASMSGAWQAAAAALERLKELMDAPIKMVSPANPVAAPSGRPEVTLTNVCLNYGEAKILRDLTLTAEAGKTTALVGASGAGKSTIFNLLTRLVDPQNGSVQVGGIAVQNMALPKLRDLFSVVTQEALLFDESLRENILLGRTDVTDEQLEAVLDAAHVSDFLPKLADGLETLVGPRGSALSGGQRQRVVIARALLRDTPILLLDEATSALDAQSEKVVQEALDRLSGGRTTIVIAHRLSTIRNADKIVVMDRGTVVDQGSHEDLLARGGMYADLYRLQFEDGKTIIDPQGAAALSSRQPDHDPSQTPWHRRLMNKIFGS